MMVVEYCGCPRCSTRIYFKVMMFYILYNKNIPIRVQFICFLVGTLQMSHSLTFIVWKGYKESTLPLLLMALWTRRIWDLSSPLIKGVPGNFCRLQPSRGMERKSIVRYRGFHLVWLFSIRKRSLTCRHVLSLTFTGRRHSHKTLHWHHMDICVSVLSALPPDLCQDTLSQDCELTGNVLGYFKFLRERSWYSTSLRLCQLPEYL